MRNQSIDEIGTGLDTHSMSDELRGMDVVDQDQMYAGGRGPGGEN